MSQKNIVFYLTTFVLLSPLLVLGIYAASNKSDIFEFLLGNVLDDVILNSLGILISTAIGVLFIGISCAWVVVNFSFPGKVFLQFLLIMPLAIPPYILAYIYTDFFDTGGSLYQFWGQYGYTAFLPEIRTVWGASFILTFCLYPYVYLFARNGFLSTSKSQIEASQLLGAGRLSQFFEIALPSARPFIIVGLTLVAMEILADFGTMDYFGIRVFSTLIYDAWAGYGDITAAGRLSLMLLAFVILFAWVEKTQRSRMRFYSSENSKLSQTSNRKGKIWMSFFCFFPPAIGFVFPVILLFSMVFNTLSIEGIGTKTIKILPYLLNSLVLCSVVAILGVLLAYVLSSERRERKSRVVNSLYTLCGFGYALPGIILGLGLLLISSFFSDVGILATGTIMFLIVGYIIRFLNIALQSLDAGFEKISPSITYASFLMKRRAFDDFWHIKRPLLMPSMISAGLILAVEVIKELPITLVLRPFDFDTLAVHTYQLASDERLAEAAFPAIFIVIAGCLPVFFLQKISRRSE